MKFSGMISTNETGALLVEMLKQHVTRDDMLKQITAQYNVDEETAMADLNEFLELLRKLNLLIDE